MNFVSRFERLAEQVFERDLPRLFGGRIDPSELALTIDRFLDTMPGDEPPPRAITLRLNPADLEEVRNLPGIESDLSIYAASRIAERWPGVTVPPIVRLEADASLDRRVLSAAVDTAGADQSVPTSVFRPRPNNRPTSRRAFLWEGNIAMPLERFPIAIGRALDNDIVLDDVSVSRYHSRIQTAGSGFQLVDLQSRNGTFLNGQPVSEPRRLRDGDTVRVGAHTMRFAVDRPARR